MKKILLMLLLCLFFSCGKKQDSGNTSNGDSDHSSIDSSDVTEPTGESNKQNAKVSDSPLIGTYTGGFEATVYDETKDYVYENRITISVDSLTAETLYGHSVVAGNNRPFKGPYKMEGKLCRAEVTEPGDDKYDGKFIFTVDPAGGKLEGTWKANNSKLDVSERKYSLDKKNFKYNASNNLPEDVQWAELYEINPRFPDRIESLTGEVTKLNASVRELSKKDVENLYKGDLEIIRNAIYARHGYSFKTRRVRFIFDRYVPWYMPVSTDVRNELTEIEKKNIDLIKRYEDHAEKYYDEYGR